MTSEAAGTLAEAGEVRGIDEMIAAAARLQQWPSLEAVVPLARLDRRAPRWLLSFASWTIRTVLVLSVAVGLVLFWAGAWLAAGLILVYLVDQLYPGVGLFVVAGSAALGAGILLRDRRYRALMASRLAPDLSGLAGALRACVHVGRVLAWLAMLASAAFFPVAICAPVGVTLAQAGVWLAAHARQAAVLGELFGPRWMLGVAILGFILALGVGLRSLGRRAAAQGAGLLLWAWGVGRLAGAAGGLWAGPAVALAGVLIGLSVLFPSRIPLYVAGSMALPLRWMVRTARWLAGRVRLRRSLRRAIRFQRQQNVGRTGKKWKLAVCAACIARLERQQVRLAYYHRLWFSRCRNCHSDQACYRGARVVEGWLDRAMAVGHEQVGDRVRVNLLHYLEQRERPLPLDLDLVVVGDATDHQVEAFLTIYQERGQAEPVQPLSRLKCRVEPNSSIGPNVRAMLDDTFGK